MRLPRLFKPLAVVLAATLQLASAETSAQPLTKVRFMLDWRFEGPSALFLLAKAKGYFAAEGLDVDVDPGSGGGTTVTRVASGAYDIGFADMGSIIEYSASNLANPATRVEATYLVYESAPLSVFSMKGENIVKPADLVGKTLGAPVFDPGRRMFPVFAKANNIDPASVKWTTMDPAMRETLLQRGDVQGITGFYFTSLIGLNTRGVSDEQLNIMKYSDYGLKLYGNSIFATKKYIDENPKVMAAFIRAFTKGARDVVADPDKAIDYVKAREPLIDVTVERRRLKLALDSSIATPAAKANGIGKPDKAVIEKMVSQVVEAYGLKQSPDPADLFDDRFLPPAADRAIFR